MIGWILAGVLALASPLEASVDAIDRGAPDEAIAALTPLTEVGGASAAVHYTLGCAYYRGGDVPRAVAHWRHAHLLKPRNGDIVHNLALGRGELRAVEEHVPAPQGWMEIVTAGELGLVGCATTLCGSWLVLAAFRREESLWTGAGVTLVGLTMGSMAAFGAMQVLSHPTAVVVEAARVRDAPTLEAAERFMLKPGTETRVIRERGDFLLVETHGERRGWISSSATEIPRL